MLNQLVTSTRKNHFKWVSEYGRIYSWIKMHSIALSCCWIIIFKLTSSKILSHLNTFAASGNKKAEYRKKNSYHFGCCIYIVSMLTKCTYLLNKLRKINYVACYASFLVILKYINTDSHLSHTSNLSQSC